MEKKQNSEDLMHYLLNKESTKFFSDRVFRKYRVDAYLGDVVILEDNKCNCLLLYIPDNIKEDLINILKG